MRKPAITIALTSVAVILAAGTALAGTAAKTKTVAFTGNYAGTAVVKVTNDIAAIASTAKGTGTLVGAGSKLTGKGTGDTKVQPCVPFGGTGSIVSKNGKTKLNFKVKPGASGCGDESGTVFSVTGRITVTGGAGAYAKAKGSLKFTGNFDRGTTKFSVKFKGTLTV